MLKSNRFSMFAVLGATSAISLVSEIAAASPNFVNQSDRIQLPNSKVAQLNEPQVLASPLCPPNCPNDPPDPTPASSSAPNLTGKWKANDIAKLQAMGCTTPACEKPYRQVESQRWWNLLPTQNY